MDEVETGFGKLPAGVFRLADLNDEHWQTMQRWFAHADATWGANERRRRAYWEKVIAVQAAKDAACKAR